MSRVTGLALRGPIYSGIPTPGTRCCSTHRGSSLIRSRLSLLHPEYRTPGRQRFELFWSAGDTVELPKKLDPMGHLARELPQNGAALSKRQLDEVYTLLIAATRQDPPPRNPRVLDPVRIFEAGDDVAFSGNLQR